MTNNKYKEISEFGPGWAITDYEGEVKPGRWATFDDAWEFGACGRYLLSGLDAIKVDA